MMHVVIYVKLFANDTSIFFIINEANKSFENLSNLSKTISINSL